MHYFSAKKECFYLLSLSSFSSAVNVGSIYSKPGGAVLILLPNLLIFFPFQDNDGSAESGCGHIRKNAIFKEKRVAKVPSPLLARERETQNKESILFGEY